MEAPPAFELPKVNAEKQQPQQLTSNNKLPENDLSKENTNYNDYQEKPSDDKPIGIKVNNNIFNNTANEINDQIKVNSQSKDVQISSSSEMNINNSIQLRIRSKFMIKVFGILLFQLIITFACVLITQIEKIKWYLQNNITLCIVLLCVSIFIYLTAFIIFTCNPKLTRKVPINYIILFAITISFTVIVSLISSVYSFPCVLGAMVYLIAICLAIFGIALFNKIDITYLAMALISLCFLALSYGLLAIIMRNYYLIFFYCILVAVLYAFFIVYDTILIRDHFDIDDYIFAALTLYFDIIRLFILILRILGSRSNN